MVQYLQDMFFWFVRSIIICFPTIFSYLGVFFSMSKTERTDQSDQNDKADWTNGAISSQNKKTIFDLLGDGQICFIAFSVAASSITNLFELCLKRSLMFGEIIVFVFLWIASFSTIAFYYYFNKVFVEKQNDDVYSKERISYRNKAIYLILGFVVVLSLITDVFLCKYSPNINSIYNGAITQVSEV